MPAREQRSVAASALAATCDPTRRGATPHCNNRSPAGAPGSPPRRSDRSS